jgi:dynein heavy chain
MGSYYAESPAAGMEEVYNLSSNILPIIFILSPGADPSSNLLRFSKDKDQM